MCLVCCEVCCVTCEHSGLTVLLLTKMMMVLVGSPVPGSQQPYHEGAALACRMNGLVSASCLESAKPYS